MHKTHTDTKQRDDIVRVHISKPNIIHAQNTEITLRAFTTPIQHCSCTKHQDNIDCVHMTKSHIHAQSTEITLLVLTSPSHTFMHKAPR